MGPFRIGIADIFHADGKLPLRKHGVHCTVVFLMDLSGELDQLPDPVGGYGAVQKARQNAGHVGKGRGQGGSLLQKEGHGAVGDLMGPEPVEAVAEGYVLDQHLEHRRKDPYLNGKEVVFQT